jgi:hypothetical protein
MTDLLKLVLSSHGGFDRWGTFKTIDADMSITGFTWKKKGWEDVLKKVHVTAQTRLQKISYTPFTAEGRRSVYEPIRVRIETLDGELIKERSDPRAAFEGHTVDTPWDDLHLAYFSGYAMWNYLNTPFLFTGSGFQTEEIEPWSDRGTVRRRLKVTYPSEVASHCSEQILHVDDTGLIARLDYRAHVAGGRPTAHYMSNYKEFQGIMIPTSRRAVRRNENDDPISDPVLVAIDIAGVTFS